MVKNMIFINKPDIANLMQNPMPVASLMCATCLNKSCKKKEVKLTINVLFNIFNYLYFEVDGGVH